MLTLTLDAAVIQWITSPSCNSNAPGFKNDLVAANVDPAGTAAVALMATHTSFPDVKLNIASHNALV